MTRISQSNPRRDSSMRLANAPRGAVALITRISQSNQHALNRQCGYRIFIKGLLFPLSIIHITFNTTIYVTVGNIWRWKCCCASIFEILMRFIVSDVAAPHDVIGSTTSLKVIDLLSSVIDRFINIVCSAPNVSLPLPPAGYRFLIGRLINSLKQLENGSEMAFEVASLLRCLEELLNLRRELINILKKYPKKKNLGRVKEKTTSLKVC